MPLFPELVVGICVTASETVMNLAQDKMENLLVSFIVFLQKIANTSIDIKSAIKTSISLMIEALSYSK